jgi:hypothetical protein
MKTYLKNKRTMQPVSNAQILYTDEVKNPYYVFQQELSASDGSFNFDESKSNHLFIQHPEYLDLYITLQPTDGGAQSILLEPKMMGAQPINEDQKPAIKSGFNINYLAIPALLALGYLFFSKQK